MNLNEMHKLWNSGKNLPTPEERSLAIDRFTHTLTRRRRQERAWLMWTFFVLTLLTGFAGWVLFGTNKVNLAREWAVLPLLLIPWAFACLFLKRHLSPDAPRHRGDISIADSLRNAMAANNAERFKLKALGIMYLVVLPVLALGIWQLHSIGKVSSRELISMVTFLGTALALSAAAVFARYRLGVLPESRKLNDLLNQFETSSH